MAPPPPCRVAEREPSLRWVLLSGQIPVLAALGRSDGGGVNQRAARWGGKPCGDVEGLRGNRPLQKPRARSRPRAGQRRGLGSGASGSVCSPWQRHTLAWGSLGPETPRLPPAWGPGQSAPPRASHAAPGARSATPGAALDGQTHQPKAHVQKTDARRAAEKTPAHRVRAKQGRRGPSLSRSRGAGAAANDRKEAPADWFSS